jgi:hypothetical protein
MRGKSWVSLLLLPAVSLAGCTAPIADNASPATIDEAGLARSVDVYNDQIHITFDDGRDAWVMLSGRRLINGPGGDIVIIGHDIRGGFVAGYTRQDGLPSNCYFDDMPGIDRGGYVELRDVLWSKTSDFSPAVAVAAGAAYPAGTRFCFNESGLIWATVAS